MKITLVGRPEKVIDRGQCIITRLQSSKVPALPKGVPALAQTATPYATYIPRDAQRDFHRKQQGEKRVIV